ARQLAAAGLLIPWPLKVKLQVDQQPVPLSGLHCVDMQRLNSLGASTYASLQGAPRDVRLSASAAELCYAAGLIAGAVQRGRVWIWIFLAGAVLMASEQAKLPDTVTVDGKHYNLADLSDNGRAQLGNLRFVDNQTLLLKNRRALVETARVAYVKALAGQLPEKKAAANRKKDVVTIDGERYRLEDFSDAGRAQLVNIRFAEQEMERLNNEQSVAQMARLSYARVLADELQGLSPLKTQ
ncbi:MAG: SapC family protein, partial [Gammaproteobacteria bacterium]|nr:SapC family protein [Gammaproteobacteria bacterium]